MTAVPSARIRPLLDAPPRPEGEYVLYWMTSHRRAGWNFALQRAVEWCTRLRRPLVVLEALRAGYPFASDRFHRFVLEGMADNAAAFAARGVVHLPYVEPRRGAAAGLLAHLAEDACAVVTDEAFGSFLPGLAPAALGSVRVHFEAVDSNGLLPVRAPGRSFTAARFFRLYLQRELRPHLEFPLADPLARRAFPELSQKRAASLTGRRWPLATKALLAGRGLEALPIRHDVGPVAGMRGGAVAAAEALDLFLGRLDRYGEDRNHPDLDATSRLSPWLHFGHLSAHQVFARVAKREGWTSDRLATKAMGGARGWWGMSGSAEDFLEELVTWRELGFNFAAHRDDPTDFSSLPTWAQQTLRKHAKDPRPHCYDRTALEEARTHDALWNAAQRQLVREGRIHNYLRMLWSKKVLEWSRSPEEALQTLLVLNDRYALDGRDPNTASGVLWAFGRYDRAWGPERPIFGTVRYMSSDATVRKVRVKQYLARFSA